MAEHVEVKVVRQGQPIETLGFAKGITVGEICDEVGIDTRKELTFDNVVVTLDKRIECDGTLVAVSNVKGSM